jgi:hypothetical protein
MTAHNSGQVAPTRTFVQVIISQLSHKCGSILPSLARLDDNSRHDATEGHSKGYGKNGNPHGSSPPCLARLQRAYADLVSFSSKRGH